MSDKILLGELKPTDKSLPESSDTGAVMILEAKPGKGGDLASDDGHDGHIRGFTAINSAAVVEASNKDTEEDSTTQSPDATPKKRAADANQSEQPSKKRSPPNNKSDVGAKDINGSTEPKHDNTGGSATTTPVKKRGLGKATSGNVDAIQGGVRVTPEKDNSATKKAKSVRFLIEPVDEPEANAASAGPFEHAAIQATLGMITATEYINLQGNIRQRMAPKNAVAAPRDIPTSWEDADEADQMLVTMKEDGVDWNTIREAWTAKTGQKTAGSTLPNRYKRIKIATMQFREGDAERLLAANIEVERRFQSEKLGLIAARIRNTGGALYPLQFLQKKLRELESDPQPQPAPKPEPTTTGNPFVKEEDVED